MVIEDLQAIVQNNVDDNSANVDEAIDMAINFLSNFFSVRKIDDSQTVATGGLYVAKPDRGLKIINVKIGTNYLIEADLTKMQNIEDSVVQSWYVEDEFIAGADNKIHFTNPIDAADNGATVYIQYLSGFTPLGGVALSNTDLPERLEPLLISFATYFYYGILVSYVKNNKSSFENMTVWDVIAIWDTWRVHSFDLLDLVNEQKKI